jgi:uncharacterized OB-fold protein
VSSLEFLEPRLIDSDASGTEPGDALDLAASSCEICGRLEFPRRDECPLCATPMNDASLNSRPKLVGFTSVLHPAPGAKVEAPYHVGVAEFEGGLRVMGLLAVTNIEETALGDDLKVIAYQVGERATYAFAPC